MHARFTRALSSGASVVPWSAESSKCPVAAGRCLLLAREAVETTRSPAVEAPSEVVPAVLLARLLAGSVSALPVSKYYLSLPHCPTPFPLTCQPHLNIIPLLSYLSLQKCL